MPFVRRYIQVAAMIVEFTTLISSNMDSRKVYWVEQYRLNVQPSGKLNVVRT